MEAYTWLTLCCLAIGVMSAASSCPNNTDMESFGKESQCFHDEVSVFVTRTPLMNDDLVQVNYFVTRKITGFVPITVDIYRGEDFLAAARCENVNLVDRGVHIGTVTFAGRCADPTVTANSNVTITIGLDLHVILSDQEQTCSTVTIGPQRLQMFSELMAGELTPFVRLVNVDSCTRSGPAVPIRLSTSTNSSITLHPDGSSESDGGISVWPLPCNDSHTQVYRVSVISTENYTLYGEIPNALLPTSCIFVTVPMSTSTPSTIDHTSTIIISVAAGLMLMMLVCVIFAIILWCPIVCRKWHRHGDYEINIREFGNDHEDRHPVIKASREQREPSTGHHASCADI